MRLSNWLLVIAIAGFPAAARALAGPLQQQPPRPVREEAFQMTQAYLISNLQSGLGLNDTEFAKVVPLVKAVQSARRQLFEERADRLRKLRQLLASGTATEGSIDETLRHVKETETKGPERLRGAIGALDAALTPIQQAKYRVLEADVEARMRRLLTRGHRGRRGAREDQQP